MTGTPKPGEVSGEPPKSPKPPRPKRGAFPTPKSEIENATPFVPDAADADREETKHDPASDADDRQEEG